MSYYEKSNVRLATVLNIRTTKNTYYYLQNFSPKSVFQWGNNVYEFVPINYTPPSRSVEMSNTALQVVLPNFPSIIQAMDANDGFINSIVQAIIFYPDDINANPVSSDLMLISGTSIQGTSITFELESPISTIQGTIPSVYFNSGNSTNELVLFFPGYLPEAPLVLIDKIS